MSAKIQCLCLGLATAFVTVLSVRAQDTFPAPARFWAAQTAPDTISLNWNGVPGVRYYRLYSVPGDGVGTAIGEARGATADWWVFPVKSYGQAMRFAIEAVSESGAVSRRVMSNEVVPRAFQPPSTWWPPAPAVRRFWRMERCAGGAVAMEPGIVLRIRPRTNRSPWRAFEGRLPSLQT